MPRTCEICGKPFSAKPSLIAKGGGRFCSMDCKGIASRKRLERQCRYCGESFEIVPSRLKQPKATGEFCSQECALDARNEQQRAEAVARAESERINGRVCSRCGQHKRPEKYTFNVTRQQLKSQCKDCCAEAQRVRLTNPDERLLAKKRTRAWRQANRDYVLENNKERYWNDPERYRAIALSRWRSMPEDERRAYQRSVYARRRPAMREYYLANRERYRERERLYTRLYPERVADKEARRRARKRGTQRRIIDRLAIIARDKSTCYLCGKVLHDRRQLTLDHVVPLARGGTHTEDNLRVACRSCNSRKHIRLLSELDWLESQLTG